MYPLAAVAVPRSGRLTRAFALARGRAAGRTAPTGIEKAASIRVRLRILPTATATPGVGRYRTARITAAGLRNRR